MFRNILGDIRKAMGVSKPFQELDKIANGITLTNDFNRPLKYIINKSGSNILPKHSMEDVANVIELTIPMALSTNEAGS